MKHTSPENTLIFTLWDTVAKEDEHAISNVGRTQDQWHHGVTLVVPLQNELQREERPGTTGGSHSLRDTKETSISNISLHLMGGRGGGSWVHTETETTSACSSLLYVQPAP